MKRNIWLVTGLLGITLCACQRQQDASGKMPDRPGNAPYDEGSGGASQIATNRGGSDIATTPPGAPLSASPAGRDGVRNAPPSSHLESDLEGDISGLVRRSLEAAAKKPGAGIKQETLANIRIASAGGNVRLRGAVATAEEKSALEALVRDIPGVNAVDNQIDVSPRQVESGPPSPRVQDENDGSKEIRN